MSTPQPQQFTLLPWLVWIFPFAGALLTPLLAKLSAKLRDYGAVLFSLLAAISAILLVPDLLQNGPRDIQLNWIASLGVKAGVLIDPLTVLMANVVAWISFLIMVYSIGYMHGDKGLTRYWFFMNLFIGNMLLLVMSDNFLQLMFGWEGVGLCSYALIGFWYTDEPDKWVGSPGHTTWKVPMAYSPSQAGMKAFIVTRIGDIGLLIAIFLIYIHAGTFNYAELSRNLGWAADLARGGLLLPAAALFFLGPIGKSAQLPLHEWLPDAMAGPTSVSALIHAATMVKAGVFLVARIGPILFTAFRLYGDISSFFELVAWIGGLTAFLAATQAVVSREIKKVLAYSTVSQIGYMMLALGAGGLAAQFAIGLSAGMFHLVSHALFKAAAFLAAGALLHACETRFLDEMGGLRSRMKITFLAMTLAMLSLSGVPPLSGFWTKDAVLETTLEASQYPLFVLAALTAALTFFYSLKTIGLAFLGKRSGHLDRLVHEGIEVREARAVMWIPYTLLAVGSLALGLAWPLIGGVLQEFLIGGTTRLTAVSLAVETTAPAKPPENLAVLTSLAMLALGGIPGYLIYISRNVDAAKIVRPSTFLGELYNFLWNRWYINPAYYRIFAFGGMKASSMLWRSVEQGVFDPISSGVAGVSVALSKAGDKIDFSFIDGAVNSIATTGRSMSTLAKRIQTGIPQQYLLIFAIGLFLLVLVSFYLP